MKLGRKWMLFMLAAIGMAVLAGCSGDDTVEGKPANSDGRANRSSGVNEAGDRG